MKSICALSLLLLLVSCNEAASQPDHLSSLRAKYAVAFNIDGCDFGEPTLLDYVINRILPDTTYLKYITDRTLLRKLKTTTCLASLVEVRDILDDGRPIEASFRITRLDTNLNTIELGTGEWAHVVERINGEIPYGANYWHENYKPKHFTAVEISIGGKELVIPAKAFSNLYQPNLCFFSGWTRPLEIYTESNNLYIYLVGGNAATTYFAKVIFEDYGSFRPNFPGF